MADVLIRNVDQSTLEALKRRAERHRRSLQQELLTILEAAVREPAPRMPAELAATLRTRLAQSGRTFSDSTALIREDRER